MRTRRSGQAQENPAARGVCLFPFLLPTFSSTVTPITRPTRPSALAVRFIAYCVVPWGLRQMSGRLTRAAPKAYGRPTGRLKVKIGARRKTGAEAAVEEELTWGGQTGIVRRNFVFTKIEIRCCAMARVLRSIFGRSDSSWRKRARFESRGKVSPVVPNLRNEGDPWLVY